MPFPPAPTAHTQFPRLSIFATKMLKEAFPVTLIGPKLTLFTMFPVT